MYIQKSLTLRYTAHALNLLNSHSFFNVGLTHCFFFLRILSIFNTHARGEGRRFFKETYSGVYPKGPNSWIHSTGFKPLKLTLILQSSKCWEEEGKKTTHSMPPSSTVNMELVVMLWHEWEGAWGGKPNRSGLKRKFYSFSLRFV